jgi:hypothetical protein
VTFAALKTETFRRLQEAASSPVYFSAADVATALNEGYMELSDAAEWFERRQTIDLLHDRPYYDLRDVIGTALLTPGAAFNVQTNRWLRPSVPSELDAVDARWERHTSQPDRIVLRGLWWVGYTPRVQADSGTITQYYTALPDELRDDDDEPGFAEEFHEGIIEFALADLWAQDMETARALEAWQRYLAIEAGLIQSLQGRLGVPLVHGYARHA